MNVKFLITAIYIDVAQYATMLFFGLRSCLTSDFIILRGGCRQGLNLPDVYCRVEGLRTTPSFGRPTIVCGGREIFCRLEHLFTPRSCTIIYRKDYKNYVAHLELAILLCNFTMCYRKRLGRQELPERVLEDFFSPTNPPGS